MSGSPMLGAELRTALRAVLRRPASSIVLIITIFYIFNTVGKMTGLEIEDMVKQDPKKQKKKAAEASADSSTTS